MKSVTSCDLFDISDSFVLIGSGSLHSVHLALLSPYLAAGSMGEMIQIPSLGDGPALPFQGSNGGS